MTPAEYLESQTRYTELSKRQLQLEAQILSNQNDQNALSQLRAEYRKVTTELSNILINNIDQASHGNSN
jgi:ABC-type phosphate transport system auxiliary subunit